MGFFFTNLPTQTNNLNGAAAGAVAIAGCVTFRGENINSALTGQPAAATVHYGVVGTVHRNHGAQGQPVAGHIMGIGHTVINAAAAGGDAAGVAVAYRASACSPRSECQAWSAAAGYGPASTV